MYFIEMMEMIYFSVSLIKMSLLKSCNDTLAGYFGDLLVCNSNDDVIDGGEDNDPIMIENDMIN
jgi:hypothetical protein